MMSRGRESFSYPLLAEPQSIRVLQLLPARNRSNALQCELKVVSLTDRPSYEALSYAWDSQLPSDAITCGNHEIAITANCASALRRLRRRFCRRTLWIDSIRIDQSNEKEKSHQVPLMSEVYGLSCRVIVWLGESTPNSDLSFKYLLRFKYILALSSGGWFVWLSKKLHLV
jgi:hypothetical protein